MFSYRVLLTSCLILTLSTLSVQACPNGSPESTAYIRRNSNRCEGIVRQLPGESQTGSLRIISLITHDSSTLGNTVVLRIPRLSNSSKPELTAQSLKQNYLLDNLVFSQNFSNFTFNLPTNILKKVGISLDDIRVLASVKLGNNFVFVPVILGQPAAQYKFVLFTQYRASFPTLQIRNSNGQIVYSNPRPNFQSPGEVFIAWDGRKQPAGRYVLHIVGKQERDGRKPKEITRNINFEHNPGWLR
ncbi:hypothetical protein [Fischerella sp. PCC 9605]|uniref:hypothetical protein n=1 Tax=Fischerella sp. PCC 9605 TaxID=1173024 RepID=UPI0004AD6B60|nr:hypothetical protein [Fischerella sp. PCC 9605]